MRSAKVMTNTPNRASMPDTASLLRCACGAAKRERSDSMVLTVSALILGMALLFGCATSTLPLRPPGELFRGIEAPPAGSARVYFFRPGFSSVSAKDSPTLSIDGREVVRLTVESYTEVTVKPGTYLVGLKPNSFESRVWSGTWQLNVEENQIYFLALWNDIELSISPAPPAVIPAGPFFLIIPSSAQGESQARNKALHFEPVSQKDALPIISTLTYVAPLAGAFEPKAP